MIPNKFLCKYPLRLGSYVVGVLMSIIMLISIIATLIQAVMMKKCEVCPEFTARNAYGFSITAVIYSVFMLIVNLWFIWGVKYKRSWAVLGWAVITVMWLSQLICLLIVLIIMYSRDVSLVASLMALIFGFIAIALLFYCWSVGLAYWVELKHPPNSNNIIVKK